MDNKLIASLIGLAGLGLTLVTLIVTVGRKVGAFTNQVDAHETRIAKVEADLAQDTKDDVLVRERLVRLEEQMQGVRESVGQLPQIHAEVAATRRGVAELLQQSSAAKG